MEQITITGIDDLCQNPHTGQPSDVYIGWTIDPVFKFDTEVDALQTFQALAEELQTARQQERHILRYMEAAAKAARAGTTQDGRVSPQAIIGHTGVARATVYKWIGEKSDQAGSSGDHAGGPGRTAGSSSHEV